MKIKLKSKLRRLVVLGFVAICCSLSGSKVFAQNLLTPTVSIQLEQEKINKWRKFILQQWENSNSGEKAKEKGLDKLDVEKLKPEAEKLYAVMKAFVDESDKKGISAEDFDDYVKSYLIQSSSGAMSLCNREDFEEYMKQHSNMERIFRGINDLKMVDSFRNGTPYIGGPMRGHYFSGGNGSALGSGIYTTSDVNYASGFADNFKFEKDEQKNLQWMSASDSVGGILEMAIDENEVEVIGTYDLDAIKFTFLYYHPEFMSFAKLYDEGLGSVMAFGCVVELFGMNYHDKFIDQAFKETFNCELVDAIKQVKSNYKNLNEQDEALLNRCLSNFREGRFDNAACFTQYVNKLNELMNADQHKPHVVDKMWAVYCDDGLLAKLLGYDVLRLCNEPVQNIVNQSNNSSNDTFLIVNPGVITVCTDASLDDDRTRPCTVEELKKCFYKDFDKMPK